MRPTLRLCCLLLALPLAACGVREDEGPIAVAVIGAPLDRAGPDDAPRLALRQATGLGLVRFDQAGQLMPGAAARWAIVDDGVDGIFRLDGTLRLDANRIARRLRAELERRPLYGEGIDRVAAVTDSVIELRLAEPRTDLLAMLADPLLADLAPEAGPFRASAPVGGAVDLHPRPSPDGALPAPVSLRGERAGRAVAGFVAGRRALVLGGTFADLAVAQAAELPRNALRLDPATGLFGLALRDDGGAYASAAMRRALDLAIDRDRIVTRIGTPGLAKATTIAGSAVEPPLADRRVSARATLGDPKAKRPPLRLWLPHGPGARLLFRLLADDWRRIGIVTVAAATPEAADFALVDQVLPPGELARAACIAAAGCEPADKQALLSPAFLPIARPVRWSLVGRRLTAFTENPLAQHPLDRLRAGR